MVAVEYIDMWSMLDAMAKEKQVCKTKKAEMIAKIRNETIREVQTALKEKVARHIVLPIFVYEKDREFSEFQLGLSAGKVYPRIKSGFDDTERGQIGYEKAGAQETFAIGMPMFSQKGEFLGRLGIGFYNNLPWAERDGIGKEIPVHYWKIEGYNSDEIQEPLTYYQYMKKIKNNGKHQ